MLCAVSSWCQGRVALLGDSAHAMQPNLGQGGCMAIEDAFQLGIDVAEALNKVMGGVPGVWVCGGGGEGGGVGGGGGNTGVLRVVTEHIWAGFQWAGVQEAHTHTTSPVPCSCW